MTMHKRFQRRKEDFKCSQCGLEVEGDGFTNHCPRCLWSRHVDLQPGDRLAECKGMMQPIGLASERGGYRILHRCQECGFEGWNQSAEGDDFERLLELAKELGNK